MEFMDIFRIKQMKTELELTKQQLGSLKEENASLKFLLKPEHQEMSDLKKEIEVLINKKNAILFEINTLSQKFSDLNDTYEKKKLELLVIDEQVLLETFALYKPKYAMQNSGMYARKLEEIREKQIVMIKGGIAAKGNMEWKANNTSEDRKMMNDTVKLLLRSLNNECETCITHVNFNNIESCEKRINASYDEINKLGSIMNIVISNYYKNLKLEELYLVHEYQLKKQEEKAEQTAATSDKSPPMQ